MLDKKNVVAIICTIIVVITLVITSSVNKTTESVPVVEKKVEHVSGVVKYVQLSSEKYGIQFENGKLVVLNIGKLASPDIFHIGKIHDISYSDGTVIKVESVDTQGSAGPIGTLPPAK